ncbi:hypothetical protein ACTNDG_08695 [Clostridium sp. HCP1S3_B4]|uniref:hypothetical protein n=1 Tax=unclassified Clostridium TaxID=2614128 RepID=UPI003F8CC1B6
MKIDDINFINYKPKGRENVKNLIGLIIVINIFLIGSFIVLFSDVYRNYANLKSGEYEMVTGKVIEPTYFSDTSSSLKVEYKDYNKVIERRVISNRYYKTGTKIDLMINKNNINDIRVISLASQYITAKWIIIATITINIILATIITFTIKNTKTSKNRSIRYNEIKSINSVMLRKNKKENHIRRVDKKYSKLKDISFNNKKVYIYIGCSLIILGVSVKLLLNFYNNYIIKNSLSWDIVSARVTEDKHFDNETKTYTAKNSRYTFDFYYKGRKQKVSLESIDKLKNGDMVDLAIKNEDITTVRKAENRISISNYILIICICMFFLYFTRIENSCFKCPN